jgi:hypothetical protein
MNRGPHTKSKGESPGAQTLGLSPHSDLRQWRLLYPPRARRHGERGFFENYWSSLVSRDEIRRQQGPMRF